MAKTKVAYVCSACATQTSSWAGKCGACGAWNTLEEQIDVRSTSKTAAALSSGSVLKPAVIDSKKVFQTKRISLGVPDIDEVFGGGIVAGSVCLIAGQPGIGKSTLLLQLAYNAAQTSNVLYVSGEESPEQVQIRGERLKAAHSNLKLVSSTSTNDIAATIAANEYDLVIVDSIQTVAAEEITGMPGSVSQVTNSTQFLTIAAKKTNTANALLLNFLTKSA